MKRSEAAKYARWSAAAALLLAALTTGAYLKHKWVAHVERQKAPPPVPQDVTKLTNGITFSKVVGDQKIFTVEASKATDFKDRDASLLEEVKITIFGKTGERHDTIHTQSCQYEKVSGSILCSGDVQLDLESAAEAERIAQNQEVKAEQKVHAETREVRFNRATGTAQTTQPVNFSFPSGNGEALGVEYRSEEGMVRLLKDVRLFLHPPGKDASKKKGGKEGASQTITVTGRSLDFARDSRTLHLYGPVEAQTRTAQLLGGELTLLLDTAFRAERIAASAGGNGKKPELQLQAADGETTLSAETLTAYFAPQGWLTKIEGERSVQGSRRNGKEEDELSAESASLDLQPKVSRPRELHLNGNVSLKTHMNLAREERVLETSALLLEFSPGKEGEGGAKPKHAETLGPGSIEWTDELQQTASSRTAASAAARTKLQAGRLELSFGAEGKPKQLMATGNVITTRATPGKATQTATAQSGVAKLLASGGWSQMDLQGNVNLKEGDRSGQADYAVFIRSTETAVLTGKALVRDVASETQAPRITFVRSTGEIRAEGGVRSTDFSKGGGAQLAAVPASISADAMQADAKTGRALYSGHARLWQGDSVLEADSIELLREIRVLNASGNVRAVFPQAATQSPAQALVVAQATKRTRLWHVTAGTLSYRDAESRAHLEKNVTAQSAEQVMRGAVVDLYFSRSERPNSNATIPPAPAGSTAGAQQISRAVGTGGVIVEQGTRKATAERGEYTAADGKFVMSGGNPTIYDASEGTTTGRQLTFFLADDTIIVDSENGSRTLTKHRVEK